MNNQSKLAGALEQKDQELKFLPFDLKKFQEALPECKMGQPRFSHKSGRCHMEVDFLHNYQEVIMTVQLAHFLSVPKIIALAITVRPLGKFVFVWRESDGEKGIDEVLTCIHTILKEPYWCGAGHLSMSNDTASHIWSQYLLKFFHYVSCSRAAKGERILSSVKVYPYASGHSVNECDGLSMQMDNILKNFEDLGVASIKEFIQILSAALGDEVTIIQMHEFFTYSDAIDKSGIYIPGQKIKDRYGKKFQMQKNQPISVDIQYSDPPKAGPLSETDMEIRHADRFFVRQSQDPAHGQRDCFVVEEKYREDKYPTKKALPNIFKSKHFKKKPKPGVHVSKLQNAAKLITKHDQTKKAEADYYLKQIAENQGVPLVEYKEKSNAKKSYDDFLQRAQITSAWEAEMERRQKKRPPAPKKKSKKKPKKAKKRPRRVVKCTGAVEPTIFSIDDLNNTSQKELQNVCRDHDLSTTAPKKDLTRRLLVHFMQCHKCDGPKGFNRAAVLAEFERRGEDLETYETCKYPS